MAVGDGEKTDFWVDTWCGSISLKDKSLSYTISAMNKKSKVAPPLRYLTSYPLNSNKDMPKWNWEKNGVFLVKSMYKQLCSDVMRCPTKKIWKSKTPLKIKVFMWLIEQNAILTKDNLNKRNWHGSLRCKFCTENESIIHLFFDCSLSKYVWSLMALVLGASCRSCKFDQYWVWINSFLPGGNKFYMVGLAAVCWAIWKAMNSICFEKKRIRY